jgi:uncharacterized protein (DUF1330 family)
MIQKRRRALLQLHRSRWLDWRVLFYGAGLAISFGLGAAFAMSRISTVNARIAAFGPKPAYLVASWDLRHPDQLKPFVDAAVPLAKKAGFEPLAGSKPQVLEGVWPYQGVVIVQKYKSLRALQDFWNSPEHIQTKKLREGLVDSHFVVAVEAN